MAPPDLVQAWLDTLERDTPECVEIVVDVGLTLEAITA